MTATAQAIPREAQIGDTLPPLRFGPVTRAMLALYAGASGDHNPIHIDSDFAKAAGHADVFAHGMLSKAQLARLVTGWAGQANLLSLTTRFTALTPVGAEVTVTGRVTDRYEAAGETRLRLTLTATLQDGTRTLRGTAEVLVA